MEKHIWDLERSPAGALSGGVLIGPVCPAVQERLTKQIATAVSEALQPKGVAVVIEAS